MKHSNVVVVAMLASLLACGPSPDAREVRDFERMRQQQRYDAYERSRFFANGATMQAPPAHTIARDAAFASSGRTASPVFLTGAHDSTYAADLPIAIDDATRALGARQFAISCAPCHGAAGFGGGRVAANLVTRRPPSLRTGPAAALPAGQMFRVITDGFGMMPPYGWQMPVATRWAVVAYVRSLATQPLTAQARADSSMAESLRTIDSLHAAGVPLQTIVRSQEAKR